MNQFNDRETEILCAALHQEGIIDQLAGNGFLHSEVNELAAKLRPMVREMILRRNEWAKRLVDELKIESSQGLQPPNLPRVTT